MTGMLDPPPEKKTDIFYIIIGDLSQILEFIAQLRKIEIATF